jgi:hypothetical protein
VPISPTIDPSTRGPPTISANLSTSRSGSVSSTTALAPTRLIGVEYLVSDEVYQKMPAEEKLYWHDHSDEVDAGLVSSPRQSRSEERETLALVRTLWGKVYYTWASRSDYPRGPSRLSWSDTC